MGPFGWTMMILFWVALVAAVALIVWVVRLAAGGPGSNRSDALSVLEHRLATGEITQDQFVEMKRLIEGR